MKIPYLFRISFVLIAMVTSFVGGFKIAHSQTLDNFNMLATPRGDEIIFPKCILATNSPLENGYKHESECRLTADFIDDIIK